VEVTDNEKHSGSLQKRINYGRESFIIQAIGKQLDATPIQLFYFYFLDPTVLKLTLKKRAEHLVQLKPEIKMHLQWHS
jgi:hypothetical protein